MKSKDTWIFKLVWFLSFHTDRFIHKKSSLLDGMEFRFTLHGYILLSNEHSIPSQRSSTRHALSLCTHRSTLDILVKCNHHNIPETKLDAKLHRQTDPCSWCYTGCTDAHRKQKRKGNQKKIRESKLLSYPNASTCNKHPPFCHIRLQVPRINCKHK